MSLEHLNFLHVKPASKIHVWKVAALEARTYLKNHIERHYYVRIQRGKGWRRICADMAWFFLVDSVSSVWKQLSF